MISQNYLYNRTEILTSNYNLNYNFNSSFIVFNNIKYFAYRSVSKTNKYNSRIFICKLNNNCEIIQEKDFLFKNYSFCESNEDPRLCILNDQLCCSYFAYNYKNNTGNTCLAIINEKDLSIKYHYKFNTLYNDRIDKNWQFWSQDNKIYACHSLTKNELKILEFNEDKIIKIYSSKHYIKNFKQYFIALSTPPILLNNQLFSIFHYKKIKNRKHIIFHHFFSFNKNPPFNLISYSNDYIIKGSYDNSIKIPYGKKWHQRHSGVVIIMNIFKHDDEIIISYGYKDCKTEIIFMNLKDFFNKQKFNSLFIRI